MSGLKDWMSGCAMCGHGKGKMVKMGIMMGLCCILPMVAVGALIALSVTGVLQFDALRAGGLSLVMVLLCPLLMGGMMVAMMLSWKKDSPGAHECHPAEADR